MRGVRARSTGRRKGAVRGAVQGAIARVSATQMRTNKEVSVKLYHWYKLLPGGARVRGFEMQAFCGGL